MTQPSKISESESAKKKTSKEKYLHCCKGGGGGGRRKEIKDSMFCPAAAADKISTSSSLSFAAMFITINVCYAALAHYDSSFYRQLIVKHVI